MTRNDFSAHINGFRILFLLWKLLIVFSTTFMAFILMVHAFLSLCVIDQLCSMMSHNTFKFLRESRRFLKEAGYIDAEVYKF